jgi:hypothetical protein
MKNIFHSHTIHPHGVLVYGFLFFGAKFCNLLRKKRRYKRYQVATLGGKNKSKVAIFRE